MLPAIANSDSDNSARSLSCFVNKKSTQKKIDEIEDTEVGVLYE
jgi:hypothetical protein